MTYDSVWLRTVAVPVRRVVLSRGLRRLVVLAGLVVAGWLLGGLASHAAHADTAPVLSGGEGARLHGVVRDVAAAVSKTGDVVATPKPPSVDQPSGAPPQGDVPSGVKPSPRKPGDVSTRPVSITEPVRTGRGGTKAHRAVQLKQRQARVTRVVSRDGVTRHGARAEMRQSAPVSPAPSPVHTPDHEVGTLSGAAGSMLPGGGVGGHLGRWSWQAPPSSWAPVRAPRSIPVAVRTAVDEPSFSPD